MDRSFGQILREIRHRAHLSQEELAELAGLSPRTIGYLERDHSHRPYPSSVRSLADALQLTGSVRADFLATGRGMPTQPVHGHVPSDTAIPVVEAPAKADKDGNQLPRVRGQAHMVSYQGIYRDPRDRLTQAGILSDLASLRRLTGDYIGAAQALEEALSISLEFGDRLGQANALTELSIVHRLTRNYADAAQTLQEALNLYRSLGDHTRSGTGNQRCRLLLASE